MRRWSRRRGDLADDRLRALAARTCEYTRSAAARTEADGDHEGADPETIRK